MPLKGSLVADTLRISGRKRLGPEITASIIAEDGHHCHAVKETSAQDKASRRITAHFFRAMISYHLSCKTERGKTHLTGNHASCGNCEASHYCLTPDLKDDKLARVIRQIPEERLISPFKRKETYLRHRAGLKEDDIQFIEENHKDLTLISQYILNGISPSKKNRSFAQTHFEKQMNATIDNPRPSNIVDSRFERRLRPKEDALCNQCFEKAITPEQSTKEMVQSSFAYFKKSLEDLEKRKQDLKAFFELNEKLQQFIQVHADKSISSDEYPLIIQAIEQLLNLRVQLSSKLEGAPRIKNTNSYRQDYYTLKQIITNYYQVLEAGHGIENSIAFFTALQSTLKYHSDIVDKENPFLRLELMIEETKQQLSINQFYIDHPNSIEQFSTMHFGIYENNVRRRPTDIEIETQLLEMMKKTENAKRKPLSNIINLSSTKSSSKRSASDEAENKPPLKRINSQKSSSPNNSLSPSAQHLN